MAGISQGEHESWGNHHGEGELIGMVHPTLVECLLLGRSLNGWVCLQWRGGVLPIPMARSYVTRSRWGGRDGGARTKALCDQASLILRYARRVRNEDLAQFAENLSKRTGQSISAEELQAWEDGSSFPAWVLVAALELANLPSNAKRVADLVLWMRRWWSRRPLLPLAGASRVVLDPSRSILLALAMALAIVLALFVSGIAILWSQSAEHHSQAAPPVFAALASSMLPTAGRDPASFKGTPPPSMPR
jgi:hypothetical protein